MTRFELIKHKIRVASKFNIFQFVKYNFLSKNIHRAKHKYILPFCPGKIFISKESEVVLNGTMWLNKPNGDNVLTRGNLYMPGKGKLIVNGDVLCIAGYCIQNAGVLEFNGHNRISEGSRIICHNAVKFGEDSGASVFAVIRDTTNHPSGTDRDNLSTTSAPVVIGKHVWVGTNVVINSGSVIGDGAIIGNHSMVSGVIAPRSMVAPAMDKEMLSGVYWYRYEYTKKAELEKYYSDVEPWAESADSSASDKTINTVCEVFCNLGYGKDIRDEQDLLGRKVIDSLSIMSLIVELETRFRVKIPVEKLNAHCFYSICTIASLMENLLKNTRRENYVKTAEKPGGNFPANRKPLELREEDTNKTVIQRLFENAIRNPDKVAVISGESQTTYRELCGMIYAYSEEYRKYGVEKGDRVILQAVCDPRYIAGFYACHLLSAIPVPLEKEIGEARIIEIADDVDCKLTVTDKKVNYGHSITYEILDRNKSSCVEVPYFDLEFPALEEPAEILFTTGTTGKSKGVVKSHKCIAVKSYIYAWKYQAKNDEVHLLLFPLNHSMGLHHSQYILAYGQTMIIGSANELSLLAELVKTRSVTAVCVPPASLRTMMMYKEELRLSDVEYFVMSGAPLSKAEVDMFVSYYPQTRLISLYGSTEAGAVSGAVLSDEKDVNLGPVHPFVDVRLKLENGEYTQSPGKVGLICAKGPMSLMYYYNEPELTQSIRDGEYIVTSDFGYFDEIGRLYFAGRADDVINIGGYKISPLEIETVASTSGLVKESILIKAQDKLNAEYLELLVVPENLNFSSDRLMSYITDKVEAYRVPKKITVVDELKRTYNGKLDRKAYR